MWNDRETDIDLLGHRTLATTIQSIVEQTELCPLTIGVYGNWGAGKSSILKMLEKAFREDARTICITFNGWLFQGYDDTKAVVMEAIIGELAKQQPLNEKLQKKAKALLKRVDWLKLTRHGAGLALTAFTGVPDPGLITAVWEKISSFAGDPASALSSENKEAIKEAIKASIKDKQDERNVPEEITAFRKEFEDLLKTAKADRLVVLVDDLDRCLPETAIAVLEAIRLFLYVEGTVFIIGADENMIAYAVRKHFPDLPASIGPADYTRNYLEKLIQVPFRVPPLGKTETRVYITLLLAEAALSDRPDNIRKVREAAREIFAKPWEGKVLNEEAIRTALGELPEGLKDALLLSNRIGTALAEGLGGNPRRVKRFLNTLMVRIRIAEAQGISNLIVRDTLAKLMLLERFAENIYNEIQELVARSENGQCVELVRYEEFVRGLGEPKPETKKKSPKPDDTFPAAWMENGWLTAWSRTEPSFVGVDLRPYFYISREKSPGFSTDVGLGEELNQVAEKLSTGNRMLITGLTPEVAAMSSQDAKKVFQYLAERAKQNSDWKTAPKEIEGIYALSKAHPELQRELVSLFENLPISALGSWIATGKRAVITDGTARERLDALLKKWGSQDDNRPLKAAVEALSDL